MIILAPESSKPRKCMVMVGVNVVSLGFTLNPHAESSCKKVLYVCSKKLASLCASKTLSMWPQDQRPCDLKCRVSALTIAFGIQKGCTDAKRKANEPVVAAVYLEGGQSTCSGV